MTSLKTSLAILLVLSLCACKVGPNYKRPATDGARPVPRSRSRRLAASRRAASLPRRNGPRFSGSGAARLSSRKPSPTTTTCASRPRVSCRPMRTWASRAPISFHTLEWYGFGIINERNRAVSERADLRHLGLSLNYIVDFWGQYRRATEAARATLLATEVRAERGSDYVDYVGGDRLLPAAPVRRAARVYSQENGRSRQGNPEAQQDQVQGRRERDYRCVSGADAGAAG